MRENTIRRPIRLLVFDIDGCLSRGSMHPFDLAVLQALRDANMQARTDPAVPAVTFCTGRPQPYVECLIQATAGYIPALCEGGTVLFDPVSHAVLTHASFGPREERLLALLRERVERELVDEHVMFEPGKVTHLTLLVTSPRSPQELLPAAMEIAAAFPNEFDVETTRICVHFLFKHLHKGTGVEWLSQHTGVAPEEMAGMGDARPDITFLEKMGIAGAPANAHEDVKAVADFVSAHEDAQGAIDFLNYVIAQNRRVLNDGMTEGSGREL
ncbi:MAG: HAD family phosphatase [Candidatus Hydrogenedentota bacterium]|jgi:hydroxymethylpyrimidine pyrophosphatase-like HAD family hydrolase|nr:MAG: HAD family phosphatase [Candidatus Hydrogenedentota bacterium]